jgi:hypothetical protein
MQFWTEVPLRVLEDHERRRLCLPVLGGHMHPVAPLRSRGRRGCRSIRTRAACREGRLAAGTSRGRARNEPETRADEGRTGSQSSLTSTDAGTKRAQACRHRDVGGSETAYIAGKATNQGGAAVRWSLRFVHVRHG